MKGYSRADGWRGAGRSSRRQWLGRVLAGAGAAGLTGTGCGLRQAPLPKRTFVLEGVPGKPAGGDAAPAGVLLVRLLKVAPAFDARAFVVRRGEHEFVSDPYHAFLGSPGPMLTEALAASIRGLGVFALVTTGGSQLAPTHALEGEVTELYGDYRDAARPQAVLGLELRLLHPLGGAASALRWQRTERRALALERAGADELVAGWKAALAEICGALDPDLFRRLPVPLQPQA